MAKRTNQISYGQRTKFGPKEIPQASNKSSSDLKKLQDIYQKSKQKAEAKQLAKDKQLAKAKQKSEAKQLEKAKRIAKAKQKAEAKQLARAKKQLVKAKKNIKYLGPEQVIKEFGSVEMFRNKNIDERRKTIKSMFSRIAGLLEHTNIKELEEFQKVQPNMFWNAKYFQNLREMGMNTESIEIADENKLEKYFVSAANVLSYKTLYPEERERITEQRKRENEFIERAYRASGSKMELSEFRDSYYRMRRLFIERVKGLYDSATAVEKFNDIFSTDFIISESQLEEAALKIGREINENAEEVLELNRRAAVERAKKKEFRNLSPQDQYTISQIKELGREYTDMYEEYIQQGPTIDDTFAKYVDRIYKSKIKIETKDIKLKVDPGEKSYLRSIVKENEPGHVFELSTPTRTNYYIIERHDQYKGARLLDEFDVSDLQIIEDYKGKSIIEDTDEFGFRIEKPLVMNTGSVSLPNDEDMGDLF